jgi:hypothetical protein
MLVKSCALCAASACVKCTTYTGRGNAECRVRSAECRPAEFPSQQTPAAPACAAARQAGRPHVRLHRHRRTPVQLRQLLLEKLRVAERRGHQEKPGLRQREQRHLPRHAAVAVGIPMELVHDYVVQVGVRALAQRDVRQDLRRAAKDRRVAVHRGVTGGQAHVVRAELPAEGQPLLVHQRLDRAGVDRAPALGDALEMQRRRHQRFARAGRCVEDHVLLLEQPQDRLLLRRVEREPLARGIFEKAPEQHIVAGVLVARDQIIKAVWHSAWVFIPAQVSGPRQPSSLLRPVAARCAE